MQTVMSIDDEGARQLIAGVVARAAAMGKPMAVAICDNGANLKAFLRMDGASLMASRICQDKAYTSAATRRPTHVNFERIKDDPPLLHGMVHQPRLIVFGGGYPVVVGEHCLGGIGVSGGHYTEDMECAVAALQALGARHEW